MTKETKLEFAPEQKSPTLEINNGDYTRKFDVQDQPFEAEPGEADMLLRTGFFISASPKSKAQSPKSKDQKAKTSVEQES